MNLEEVTLNISSQFKTEELLASLASLTKIVRLSIHLSSNDFSHSHLVRDIMNHNPAMTSFSLSLVNNLLPESLLCEVVMSSLHLRSLSLILTNCRVQ